MKQVFLALLKPHGLIVALAPIIIAGLMVWVFFFGNKDHPLAYAAYTLSFYLLVIVCIWATTERPARRLRQAAQSHKTLGPLVDDADCRRRASLQAGVVIDLLWGTANFALALTGSTAWFITFGCYYFLFAALRALLLRRLRAQRDSAPRERNAVALQDCRAARFCGIIILASTIILTGIAILVASGDSVIRYNEISAIALATLTFCLLTSAIIGLAKARRSNSMLVIAHTRANLAIALVSLFTLEIALLSTFSTSQDAELASSMPIATGAAIAIALCALGTATIIQANKALRQQGPDPLYFA
ncbi:MAG: hypothetical protein HFJ66_00365 [Eggerthellaceae bacterium]|nr:hypothetical protein [Eggerthellaceae bacterium]